MVYVAQFCTLLIIQAGLSSFALAQEQKAVPLAKQQSKLKQLEAKRERDRKKAVAELQRKNGCTKPDPKKVFAAKKAQEKFYQ